MGYIGQKYGLYRAKGMIYPAKTMGCIWQKLLDILGKLLDIVGKNCGIYRAKAMAYIG